MHGMGKHSPTEAATAPLRNHPWILFLIAVPAAVEVWSGWIGLGALCGFGEIHPLPGIWDSLRINTDITLPVGMEAYAGYGLYAWLASNAGETVRTFARRSAIGALVLSCVGQVAYHLLAASGIARAPSFVVVLVACLPVAVLAFAASLTHLMHADARARQQAVTEAAERAAARAAARSGNAAARPPVTPPAETAAAGGTDSVTPPVTPPAATDAGESTRKRTDEEWLSEVRKLHAEQGDDLSVRKLMPQLKLIGGGSGIAIAKATEMLRQVKAEAAPARADDDAEEAV